MQILFVVMLINVHSLVVLCPSQSPSKGLIIF